MKLLIGLLILWTGFAWVWWLLSLWLVRAPRTQRVLSDGRNRLVTLFKPTPLIKNESEQLSLQHNICSWIAQMDDDSELLLGCHEENKPLWQSFCDEMKARHPTSNLRLVSLANPLDGCANPKIAWMKNLIPHAKGELWLWSDADIHAPPGALQQLRSDYEHNDAKLITCPYVITEAKTGAAILDTLYVNAEFYPGVLLLARNNAIEFGFGSGMLFSRKDFEDKVDIEYLSRSLADDYHLGRMLQPVKLASATLTTHAAAQHWRGAISHYRRWQKTVRWNRPGGFASQLLVLPLLGWMLALLLNPGSSTLWLGIGAVILFDGVAATLLCHLLKCRLSWGAIASIPAWSLLRAGIFISCWLPIPVTWRGQIWHTPFYDN